MTKVHEHERHEHVDREQQRDEAGEQPKQQQKTAEELRDDVDVGKPRVEAQVGDIPGEVLKAGQRMSAMQASSRDDLW